MPYDVFGMCNALFDLQAEVDTSVLDELGLLAGGMFLLEADRHALLVERVRGRIVNETAGGSGANTMMGLALLGGSACFTSRIGHDPFGDAYERSLARAGVRPFLARGYGATGACAVLITPDKQRTMCTFLGEGRNLGPDDVMEAEIRQSRVLYVTGYLWDTDSQKRAVIRAIEIARQARAPVALSLSDTFCIERHHSDFRALLAESVDVVFGNADEALLLSACSEPEWAAAALGCGGRTAFVTLGASGAIAARDGAIVRVPAQAVEVVDTTGAGDAFAAGALFGLTHGADLANAAVEGIRLASRVVSKLGPRPDPN